MKKQKLNVQNADVSLRLDWCSYQAAKYAVEHWHYSKSMPRSKMVTIGIWEDEKYIGAVVFSYGATPQIGSPYGLNQYEICELTRVALCKHKTPVSKILAISLRMLKGQSPNLKMVVSFADSEQGHTGAIYQASNWIYTGTTKVGRVGFVVNGKKIHTRTIGSKHGGVQSLSWVRSHLDNKAEIWLGQPKHRYLMPLDDEIRKRIEPLRKPYPKRATSKDSVVPGVQPGEGGANPTVALKRSKAKRTRGK